MLLSKPFLCLRSSACFLILSIRPVAFATASAASERASGSPLFSSTSCCASAISWFACFNLNSAFSTGSKVKASLIDLPNVLKPKKALSGKIRAFSAPRSSVVTLLS